MRQKLGLIVTVVVVIALLVAINSVTYVTQEPKKDSELTPNRSTYHSGPTGTRALYDFLSESGYSVMRWRETPEKLLSDGTNVTTFVIVGNTPLAIDAEQAATLLHWVTQGGRLVIVDRRPEVYLLPPSGKWNVSTQFQNFPSFDVDPGKTEDMTKDVPALKPVQPTLLTLNVTSVMPSRFAATINYTAKTKTDEDSESPVLGILDNDEEETDDSPSVTVTSDGAKPRSPAPVVHLADSKGAVLLDYPHGQGRVIVLSDPFIFSNGGIALNDNLQLATNMLTSARGLIAFDEFHQGRGTTQNPLIGYFSGTPVLAFFGQALLLVLLMLWTRGRRFARPLPLPSVDRRSALEFVASMAEVQQRARAYDLAIENIYSRTRRVLARYAGVDYNSPRSEIANRVASRSALDARQLEVVMRQCEQAINGEPISERQSVHLVRRLREIETSLGLRMRSREVKQAAQRI